MEMPSYLKLIVTEHKDIVFVELRAPMQIDFAIAKEIVASRLSFTENKKHYLVADVSKVRSVTGEAKIFMQKPDGGLKNILGAALIASNPVSALIANIFIKTPTNFQARFFSDRKEAITWINEIRTRFM